MPENVNALRYYLGPQAYEPVNALLALARGMFPGSDMMDMAESSRDLMASRTPMDAANNLGWLASATLGMALPGNVGQVKQGIRAYHGSPYDFDRFDVSKVGTGEGGQLLGRGVNLSSEPEVADFYHKQLSGGRGKRYEVRIDANQDDFLDFRKPLAEQGQSVKDALTRGGIELGPVEPQVRVGRGALRYFSGGEGRMFGEIEQLSNGWFTAKVGKKNLGSFDNLEQAGNALKAEASARGIKWRGDDLSGRSAFEALGGRKSGSEALLRLGIPGTTMEGTYNSGTARDYVVFDDKIIDIVRKYGIAGLLAGGAGTNALLSLQQDSGEMY